MSSIATPDLYRIENITCSAPEQPSFIPPKVIARNEFGLICDGSVEYYYDESDLINWRKMIPSEYLVPNKQMFSKNGKTVPNSIDGLDDRELLILLPGIKHIAKIRGFTNVTYDVKSPSPNYVVATCSITFLPNYETENREVTFSAIGDASDSNTFSFARFYLGPIAENRAFVRAVRNFLRINIVGSDEIGSIAQIDGGASNPNTKTSTHTLREVMAQYNVSFDLIKKRLVEEKYIDENKTSAEQYTNEDNIPTDKQFEIISRIKKKASDKEKISPPVQSGENK